MSYTIPAKSLKYFKDREWVLCKFALHFNGRKLCTIVDHPSHVQLDTEDIPQEHMAALHQLAIEAGVEDWPHKPAPDYMVGEYIRNMLSEVEKQRA